MFWFKQSNLYKHENVVTIRAFSCSVLCPSLAAKFYIFVLSHGSVILHRMGWTQETPLLHYAYFNKPAQHQIPHEEIKWNKPQYSGLLICQYLFVCLYNHTMEKYILKAIWQNNHKYYHNHWSSAVIQWSLQLTWWIRCLSLPYSLI